MAPKAQLNYADTNHPFADNRERVIFMLAKDCLEEFKVECDLRRLGPRTAKGYYHNTALFLNYLEKHDKITTLEAININPKRK